MTTVTGKLIGYAAPQHVEMRATLVDVTGKDAVGYVASVHGELVRPVTITPDTDGDWTVELTPNSLITSQSGDTLWAIQEGRAKDGTPVVSYIAVPESGTTWWVGDILADLSSTQTGDSTVVYLASAPGADGASAYEVAVANGFVGSEAEWLAGLVGPEGAPGPAGATGAQGPKGDTGDSGPQPPLGAAGAGPTIALKSDDPTTTNARTPTAHKTSHATGGSDALTPADIGAETTGTAAAAVTEHAGATDPHGDRAYTDTQTATRVPTTRQITAGTGLTGGGTLAADRTLAVAYGTSAGTAAAGDDTRITGALQASGGTISGNLAVTGNALGEDTPAAHGIAAWCYDPALAVNSTQLTAGTLYLVRVNIAANVNATKIYWWVANTGSGATTNQNLVGLYDSAGTLLASANVDASFSSATLKTTTIPSTALSAGSFYWVALLFNASVTPTLTRASGWTGVDTAANLGLAASAYRFAKNGTSRTSLPSTITPASNVGTDFAGPWAAVGA